MPIIVRGFRGCSWLEYWRKNKKKIFKIISPTLIGINSTVIDYLKIATKSNKYLILQISSLETVGYERTSREPI